MAAIEGKGLKKTYRMGEINVEALKGVDLAMEKGSFTSIMGPSGSGKSTLMHILGLLDRPTEGTVTISGRDTADLSDRQRAAFRLKKIGFVFQFYSLLSGFESYENVFLPMFLSGSSKQASIKRSKEVLERVGLGDRLKHRPSELSGGQRQRVAIARAIVNDPDIILADEPNSQLDTETSEEIMELFQDLANDGHTVITVNHEEEFGRMAENVIWLEDGLIQEE
jgi:putative ABC transport system ATP-binding protein